MQHTRTRPSLVREVFMASCDTEEETAWKERATQEREIARETELRQQAEARADVEEYTLARLFVIAAVTA